ncbi:MAG TPA: hypothetical protein VMG12_20395 [Polyangiaceae bacterium]|nr:hypothetical protein [Polyangiaceae bacterium]
MAPTGDAATAELCRTLGVPLPDGDAGEGDGGAAPGGELTEAGGPRWRPLALVPIPGLDTLVGIVKPPLDVIKALLQVIAGLLSVLSAILIGLLDPYRAIILAAYQALKDLLEDLLNSGAYFYYDAPGITSHEMTLADMGVPTEPAQTFNHGREGGPPPAPVPDAYVKWGERFAQSFDDPGDSHRPVLSDGASVMAVFIVAAAPSPEALRQLLYLLGKLFNLQAFIDGFERYSAQSPDPDLSRARTDPVAPDWEAARLKDLFPPLKHLLAIPEALRTLLLGIDNAIALLKDMAQAIQEKAQVLLDMANAIQAVIDLLDSLAASGLHVLPVMTTEGVAGLKRAFVEATNRPPGGYVGGVCLLAAGPGMADATVLWNLLGQGGAFEQLEGAIAQTRDLVDAEAKKNDLAGKLQNLAGSAEQAALDLQNAVLSAPGQFVDDLGRPAEELAELVQETPAGFVDLVNEAGKTYGSDAIAQGEAWVNESRKRGPRSLALSLGARSDTPEPAPDLNEPSPDEASSDSDDGSAGGKAATS